MVAMAQVGSLVGQQGTAFGTVQGSQHPAGHDHPAGAAGNGERMQRRLIHDYQLTLGAHAPAQPPRLGQCPEPPPGSDEQCRGRRDQDHYRGEADRGEHRIACPQGRHGPVPFGSDGRQLADGGEREQRQCGGRGGGGTNAGNGQPPGRDAGRQATADRRGQQRHDQRGRDRHVGVTAAGPAPVHQALAVQPVQDGGHRGVGDARAQLGVHVGRGQRPAGRPQRGQHLGLQLPGHPPARSAGTGFRCRDHEFSPPRRRCHSCSSIRCVAGRGRPARSGRCSPAARGQPGPAGDQTADLTRLARKALIGHLASTRCSNLYRASGCPRRPLQRGQPDAITSPGSECRAGPAGQLDGGLPMSHLTYAEAIVVGLFQGVTELFPVSSLGHSVLIPALIGGQWARDLSVSAPESPYLAFIVGLHVATAVALLAYFWRDWLRIIGGLLSSLRDRQIQTPDQRLAWLLILATIPVGVSGLALEHLFRTVLGKPIPAAIFLTLNGLILYGGERLRRHAPAGAGVPAASPAVDVTGHAAGVTGHAAGVTGHAAGVTGAAVQARTATLPAADTDLASDRRLAALGFAEATLIGSAQILALLAGISRSGVTMVAGLARGLSHEDAARFSFLLATPVILAAGLLKIPDLTAPLGAGIGGQVLAGSVCSGAGAYLSVRFLVRYFQTRTLTPFAIYCTAAGLASLGYLMLR